MAMFNDCADSVASSRRQARLAREKVISACQRVKSTLREIHSNDKNIINVESARHFLEALNDTASDFQDYARLLNTTPLGRGANSAAKAGELSTSIVNGTLATIQVGLELNGKRLNNKLKENQKKLEAAKRADQEAKRKAKEAEMARRKAAEAAKKAEKERRSRAARERRELERIRSKPISERKQREIDKDSYDIFIREERSRTA